MAIVSSTSTSAGRLRRYAHGAGVDEPLIWYEGSGVSSGQNWLIADRQGSIIATTNASGAATTYAYDAYGIPREWFGSGGAMLSRFRYTGQIALPELALYHYKARVYDPGLGRFLQTDPVGYKDDLNLYIYAANDPVNRADPSGTRSAVGSRLRSQLNDEIRAARATRDTHRAAALTSQRDVLDRPEVEARGNIAPPSAAVARRLVDDTKRAPAEHVLAATESGSEISVTDTTTSTSITSARGTMPPGTVATSHKHQGGGVADDYPGPGDLVMVLQKGVPAIYFNGATNVGGAIGYDGSHFTMNPVEGLQMPEYGASNQPGYISDTFAPW